jgi:hypothetical protein
MATVFFALTKHGIALLHVATALRPIKPYPVGVIPYFAVVALLTASADCQKYCVATFDCEDRPSGSIVQF